jgi:ribosomal protein S6
MKGSLQNYQVILVLNPKTEDKDKDKILAKVESWLGGNKAKIAKKEHTGNKELVYEIAKERKGDFWILDVEAELPLKLNELNLFLNREVNVIRYLILKV